MTQDKFHKIIEDICKKERVAFPTHSVIDNYQDISQMELFEMLYDSYGFGQKSKDGLVAFKKSYQFTPTTSPLGVITLPSDYVHLNDGHNVVSYDNVKGVQSHKITFKSEEDIIGALKSQVRKVGLTNPVAEINAGVIQLYPKQGQTGYINYFRRPLVPKFVFTQSGANNRTITYDAVNSVNLEWTDGYVNMIIVKVLGYLGITYGENDLIQFNKLKEQGL